MKKQLLSLLIIFSPTCFGNQTQEAVIHQTESEKQTVLLTKQIELLKALLELQYHTALQAKQEKERMIHAAHQANNPLIKNVIIKLGEQNISLKYPKNNVCPYANQANIFYDNPLDPQEVVVLLAVEQLIIDIGCAYLLPTIQAIIINKIANKVATIAFNAVDDAVDAVTPGIRPFEFLSVSAEQYKQNELLRSPEIAALVAQRDELKAQLTPAETAMKLSHEISQIRILLAQAQDPRHAQLLAERNSLLEAVTPTQSTEKLLREVKELRDHARQQQEERNARADSGIPATGNNEKKSTPTTRSTHDVD